MAPSKKLNDWDVSFSHISFLKQALDSHSKVDSSKRSRDILFSIKRKSGLSSVVMLLINRYVVSLADVTLAKSKFPEITCICTAGNWNGYTKEAKEYGDEHGIGVFIPEEFFGALNLKDPNKYVKKNDKGEEIYAYKTPR